jgi:tetratricopeptide (TPR) repeat protein
LASVLALAFSIGFVGFAATRSDALDRARQTYDKARDAKSLAHVVRLAREHLTRQPWSNQAALLAALALSRLDYAPEAEPYYNRSSELTAADAHIRAHAIMRSNDREAAIAAYRHMLIRRPDDTRAARMLAGIYFSRRQFPEALELARALQNSRDGAQEGHRLEAGIRHDMAEPEEAVLHFERVLELDPNLSRIPAEAHLVFWFHYGTDLLAIGRAEAAVSSLLNALERDENPAIRTLLGKGYRQLGKLEEAEECWRNAIQKDPSLAAPWLELGKLQIAANQLADGVATLERAAQLAPANNEVAYALLSAYRRMGNVERALEMESHLERLRASRPGRSGAMGAPMQE